MNYEFMTQILTHYGRFPVIHVIHSPGCRKCGLDRNSQFSCCGEGGSWAGKCGFPGDINFKHTWGDGLVVCSRKGFRDKHKPKEDVFALLEHQKEMSLTVSASIHTVIINPIISIMSFILQVCYYV